MPSPRIICAAPAPSPTISSPTIACSRSSSSCSSTANSTRSGSPTRRSPGSRRVRLPDRVPENRHQAEDAMEAAIDRIMQTYNLLAKRTAAASEEARAKVTDYVTTLFEGGETDPHRLTVCGLTYLRQLDGSVDPVKEGYTGL